MCCLKMNVPRDCSTCKNCDSSSQCNLQQVSPFSPSSRAFGAGHILLLDERKKIHKRLIAVSLLRLAVGYMFLACLFVNVVQNSEVIEIFYDVLALEFVENVSLCINITRYLRISLMCSTLCHVSH